MLIFIDHRDICIAIKHKATLDRQASPSRSGSQELLDKVPQLPADIRWHFIGHLQSNKAKALLGVPANHSPYIHKDHCTLQVIRTQFAALKENLPALCRGCPQSGYARDCGHRKGDQ